MVETLEGKKRLWDSRYFLNCVASLCPFDPLDLFDSFFLIFVISNCSSYLSAVWLEADDACKTSRWKIPRKTVFM